MTNPSGWHRKNPNTPAARARKAKYDSAEHRAARKQFKLLVEYGIARCWRCGKPLPPGSPFHVGHSDDGLRIMGPEHARSCNLKAAARKGALVANAKRKAKAFVRPIR